MNIKVVYHTMTGNTKKVAEAISEAVGVPAEPVSESTVSGAIDILFIGDGVYGSKADNKTVSFIKSLSADKVRHAAVFGTYGGQKKAITHMKELLKQQGINVVDESFGCKGKSWWIINRKHPDAQDLNTAKEFAKGVLAKLG